jgi:hypothetical protein
MYSNNVLLCGSLISDMGVWNGIRSPLVVARATLEILHLSSDGCPDAVD